MKEEVDNTDFNIALDWVNSHPTDMVDIRSEIPDCIYQGNLLADKKAGLAAEEHRVPEAEEKTTEKL